MKLHHHRSYYAEAKSESWSGSIEYQGHTGYWMSSRSWSEKEIEAELSSWSWAEFWLSSLSWHSLT